MNKRTPGNNNNDDIWNSRSQTWMSIMFAKLKRIYVNETVSFFFQHCNDVSVIREMCGGCQTFFKKKNQIVLTFKSDDKLKAAFTWEVKWTHTAVKSQGGVKFHVCVQRNVNKCLHEMSVSRRLEFHCGMSFTSVMKTGVRFQPALKIRHFFM